MSKSGTVQAAKTEAPSEPISPANSTPLWSTALEQWRVTPIDDPVWDDVDGFIDALRSVTAEKITERNRGREILRRAVEELCSQCASEIEYFEAQVSSWQADAIPWNEAELLAGRVSRLHEDIGHRRTLQEERATRYSEMRKLREQIDAIEEAISAQIGEISQTFASGAASAEPANLDHGMVPPQPPENPVPANVPEEDTQVPPPLDETKTTANPEPGNSLNEDWDLGATGEADEESQQVHAEVPESLNGVAAVDKGMDFGAEISRDSSPAPLEAAAAAASTTSVLNPEETVASSSPTSAEDEIQPKIIGSMHRFLDPATGRYSPLTKMQERAILAVGSGVGIVYASSAMGFEQLPEAVTALAEEELDGRGLFEMMPPALSEGDEVFDWLSSLAGEQQEMERVTVCQPVVVPIGDIAERVEGALRFCEGRPNVPTRVLFFFSPAVVWSWLNLAEDKWQEIINRIRPIFALRPWSEDALRDRLQRHGFRSDPFVCSLVLRATGGWTWCVDKLFELAAHENDVLAAVERMERGLAPGDEFHDELFLRLGVRPETVAEAVLSLVSTRGDMDIDAITPQVVGLDSTPDECRAAVELLQTLSCFEPDNDVARLTAFMGRVMQGEN